MNVLDEINLQVDIDSVFSWSRDWGLRLNFRNTVRIRFGKLPPSVQYYICKKDPTSVISTLKETQDLGVLFDDRVSFEKHVQYVYN